MVDGGVLGGPVASGVYSEREVKEFLGHPDVLKTLDVGRAYLVAAPSTRRVIRVHYRPIAPPVEFKPTIPRKWRPGDEERLGHSIPALDLAGRVKEGAPPALGGPA
jgi:hypothetical protein